MSRVKRASLLGGLVGLLVLLLSTPGTSHDLSRAEIETLVRQEILDYAHFRRWFAFCSDVYERVMTTVTDCIERQEIGLSSCRRTETELLNYAAALRTLPQCRVFQTIAQRCTDKYGPDTEGTAIQSESFFACLKHPHVEWLEEAR